MPNTKDKKMNTEHDAIFALEGLPPRRTKASTKQLECSFRGAVLEIHLALKQGGGWRSELCQGRGVLLGVEKDSEGQVHPGRELWQPRRGSSSSLGKRQRAEKASWEGVFLMSCNLV